MKATTYRMSKREAGNAYDYLLESYCVNKPLPREVAVPRLMRLSLTDSQELSWVRVSGQFGAKQDALDAALYPVTTYSVMVMSTTSFRVNGQPESVRSCGHEHKTLQAAERCRRQLQAPYEDGSKPAAWHGATIRHSDGDRLTPDEYDALIEVRV